MRSRKPWVFALRRLFGWNVRLLTGSSRCVKSSDIPLNAALGWARGGVGTRYPHRGDRPMYVKRPRPSRQTDAVADTRRARRVPTQYARPKYVRPHDAFRSPEGHTGRPPFTKHTTERPPRLWTTVGAGKNYQAATPQLRGVVSGTRRLRGGAGVLRAQPVDRPVEYRLGAREGSER